MRKIAVVAILIVSFGCMAYLFWTQELKYALPTPVPAGYHARAVQESIDLHTLPGFKNDSAHYLHFFNPDCPCSRFNLKHFNVLVSEFGSRVKVYTVIPAYADLDRAREMIDNDAVTILQDHDDVLAQACGVYSTPQAVVVDANQKLFYRGNYNKSRYCTLKESNYAELALHALVSGAAPPLSTPLAIRSYGCELPAQENRNPISFIP